MIVGLDVHHSGKQNKKAKSVAAMVSTTDKELSKYYSNISFHDAREVLSRELCTSFTRNYLLYIFFSLYRELENLVWPF